MKSLVILLTTVVASVYGGVGQLSQAENDQALAMFEQFCANAANDGSRSAGNAMIFCKRAIENFNEEMQHNIDIPANQQGGQQVVFIQPPSTNYNHQVTLTGQSGQGQKAVIYVLPQKNTHTIRPNFNIAGPSAPAKPTVYFLRGNGANSGATATSAVGSNSGGLFGNDQFSPQGGSQGPSSFAPRPNSFGPGPGVRGPMPYGGPGPMHGGRGPSNGNYGWGQ